MKLVRDRIPEIIIEDGRQPVYHLADIDEYRHELYKKVIEELNEFREEPCLEEAADLLEAVYTLFDTHKFELIDTMSCTPPFVSLKRPPVYRATKSGYRKAPETGTPL